VRNAIRFSFTNLKQREKTGKRPGKVKSQLLYQLSYRGKPERADCCEDRSRRSDSDPGVAESDTRQHGGG